jgi:LDH2 family malate/lactate/ureidoglycolate dehydrogenase
MMNEKVSERLVDAKILEKLVSDLFRGAGVPEDEADLVADALVSADARGMTSHGVMRVPSYMNKVRAGGFKAGRKGKILCETPATMLIDGEDGLGQVITYRAMEEAIKKAKTVGNHFGEAGYYALQAVRQDMIGLVTTNGSVNTPAYGGRTMASGNLPLAVGVPTEKELPILLDIAMCAVSKGKVAYAAKQGVKIPFGWGVDSTGQPTDDPQKILDGGWLLPIGEYKGWGLILILDILSGVLTGGRVGTEITDLFGSDLSSPQGLGHFVMAINVEAFIPIDEFKKRMDSRIRKIKESELLPGFKEILMPGERELKLERERRSKGIPLIVEVLGQLKSLAEELGVKYTLEG